MIIVVGVLVLLEKRALGEVRMLMLTVDLAVPLIDRALADIERESERLGLLRSDPLEIFSGNYWFTRKIKIINIIYLQQHFIHVEINLLLLHK